MSGTGKPATDKPHKAGAFDIRTFIGGLLGLYGVILVMAGLAFTDEEAIDRAGGLNANLWTGVGLIVASGIFLAWARLRPVVVPADHDDHDDETAEAR